MTYFSPLINSPESLSKIEWWLYILSVILTVGGVLVGFLAWQVGKQRELLEQQSIQEQLTENQVKTAAIEARQAHRQLTQDQRNRLVTMLSTGTSTSIMIHSIAGDGEANKYAAQFVSVFRDAGWKVEDNSVGFYTDVTPIGLIVRIKDRSNPPQNVILLLQSLKETGINAVWGIHPKLSANIIELIVGNKP